MSNYLEATAGGSPMYTIIMLVVMVAVFYFMLIRPENKRKKEAEQQRSSLKVGDKVTTIGGIVGTVVSVKDEKFVIETGADQVRIEFAKWALSTNDSAVAAAQEEAKKKQEERAKAVAAKKAERANKKNKNDL
jgi:preprotein translocase subunit YajC